MDPYGAVTVLGKKKHGEANAGRRGTVRALVVTWQHSLKLSGECRNPADMKERMDRRNDGEKHIRRS